MDRSYVLVTPARNEQATIEITINSVISQTILPQEWVIVSDRSTDQTDAIVQKYAAGHDFIKLLRKEGEAGHSFAAVVHATEAGIKALKTSAYKYIGLLDADVRFEPDYYEKLMGELEKDPKLGLAGGMVLDLNERDKKPYYNLNEIAGATQFFSRAAFESLGALLPIPEGGWDAITCVQVRMNGFKTATFPDVIMDHLKPRNVAHGNSWRRNWQLGVRDYALGGHPLFEMLKCCGRLLESPPIIGSTARFCGYFQALLQKRKRVIPENIANYVRREQLQRIGGLIRRAK